MSEPAAPPRRFALRPLCWEDAQQVLAWRNSDRVRSFMLQEQLILPEEHQQWVSTRLSSPDLPHYLFWEGVRPLGVVGLTHYEQEHRRGEWGFYLGEHGAPAGTGTRMLAAFLEEMFSRRGLRKLCAQVLRSNEKSLHLHRKLGFNEEGLLKAHLLRGQEGRDVVMLALFDREWEAKKKAFREMIDSVSPPPGAS